MKSRLYFVTSILSAVAIAPALASGCGTDEAVPGAGGGGGGRLIGEDGGGGLGRRDARPPATRTAIGAPCLMDSECPGEDLFCLTQDGDQLLGGGPQNGICVANCTDDPTTCADIDPTSVCVVVSVDDSLAVCLEGCLTGDPAPGEIKCRDRADLACFQGFCGPACGSDFACAPQVCNLASGVCVDPESAPEDGLPIGSACDPDATEDPCNEFCLDVGGIGICSGICNVSTFGCGVDPSSTEPYDAMCLFAIPQAGLGDAGFCGQLCDCNDDCHHPNAVCSPFPSGSVLISESGRAGACDLAPAGEDAGVGLPCEGGAPDGGPPDATATPDGAAGDAAAGPEAGEPDAALLPDAGSADAAG